MPRTLLRTFFLFPLLITLLAWLASASIEFVAQYHHEGIGGGLTTEAGIIEFHWEPNSGMNGGWNFSAMSIGEFRFWSWFYIGYRPDYGGVYSLDLPYWFLTLFFTALFFLTRRLTRPRPTPAFPLDS